VAHDSLHGRQVGAAHEEQRCGVVHAPRAEGVFLAGQEKIDLPRRHVSEQGRSERRPGDVLPDARLTSSGACLAQELLDPPLHQLVDGAAATLELEGLEPEALPLVATLQVDRKSLRGGQWWSPSTPSGDGDHQRRPPAGAADAPAALFTRGAPSFAIALTLSGRNRRRPPTRTQARRPASAR